MNYNDQIKIKVVRYNNSYIFNISVFFEIDIQGLNYI